MFRKSSVFTLVVGLMLALTMYGAAAQEPQAELAGAGWTEHPVDGNFNGAISVYAADIDGDGDTDVIGAAGSSDTVTWWENTDGMGTSWSEHTIDANFDYVRSVHATDIDGDGDADVLGAAGNANEIAWWENSDGVGTSWSKHTVGANFGFADSVYAADVDGDGDTDVLGAAFVDDDIAWWENTNGLGTSGGRAWHARHCDR